MINWRRFTLIELLYVVVVILGILMGIGIFKMVGAGKFTWEHLFWMFAIIG